MSTPSTDHDNNIIQGESCCSMGPRRSSHGMMIPTLSQMIMMMPDATVESQEEGFSSTADDSLQDPHTPTTTTATTGPMNSSSSDLPTPDHPFLRSMRPTRMSLMHLMTTSSTWARRREGPPPQERPRGRELAEILHEATQLMGHFAPQPRLFQPPTSFPEHLLPPPHDDNDHSIL